MRNRSVFAQLTANLRGGGYICGPDHTINEDVPAQNTIALFKSACAFRRDGYTV